jgi:hypothetical protein
VRLPVEVDAGEVHDEELPKLLKAVAPGAFSSHWQAYGEVPPVNVADNVDCWPLSRDDDVVEGAFTLRAGFTTTVAGEAV